MKKKKRKTQESTRNAERDMIAANSLKLITPSPSVSASLIISVSSRYVNGWPIFAIAPANSAAEI
ncbi:hypothetical protein Ahy_B01g056496 isoform B [Arachis hypogaea]|uniref:Uncharacterized protein n=1 Tax=Arachis hypogaea TaxID=3818 RepID=A0A445AYX9_ARAHY|nr:hypothetical protein Ahy_B01g056496 isoform B [Arachis hypogaea]